MSLTLAGQASSSSPRKRGSRLHAGSQAPVWIPAFAGMTFAGRLSRLRLMTLSLPLPRCAGEGTYPQLLARKDLHAAA
jgi:hypothetical protein